MAILAPVGVLPYLVGFVFDCLQRLPKLIQLKRISNGDRRAVIVHAFDNGTNCQSGVMFVGWGIVELLYMRRLIVNPVLCLLLYPSTTVGVLVGVALNALKCFLTKASRLNELF